MARIKQIINGFNNSQKIRFILTAKSGENVGMYLTIKQMSEQFATTDARSIVWNALERLAHDRSVAKAQKQPLPVGLNIDTHGVMFLRVQVDLVD